MKFSAVSLNIRYTLLHLFYWAAYGLLVSFASGYLLEKGFSNALIGLILAGGNIISVVLQPIIATFLDSHQEISVQSFSTLLFAVMTALSLAIQFMPISHTVLGGLLVILLAVYLCENPLINALAFQIGGGQTICFGPARGAGSLAYALTCAAFGRAIAHLGSGLLPLCYSICFLFLTLITNTLRSESAAPDGYQPQKTPGGHSSLLAFLRRYRTFSIFILGCTLTFFAHYLVALFMLQVILAIGGDGSSFGVACALSAILELPVMLFFAQINRRIPANLLLSFTAVMFAVKQVVIMLATSVPIFYVSQLLQFGGYGLFIPTSVIYVDKLMERGDAIRGQTMLTIAASAGSTAASLLGGLLLDHIGVQGLLLVSVALSLCGTSIMLITSSRQSMRIPAPSVS